MIQLVKIAFRLRKPLPVAALCIWIAVAAGCAAAGNCGVRECSTDARITAEVRTLLAQSPELGGANEVSVQTVHGVVYLRGLVSTPYQISAAGAVAEGAAGVIDVQNLLTIDNAH